MLHKVISHSLKLAFRHSHACLLKMFSQKTANLLTNRKTSRNVYIISIQITRPAVTSTSTLQRLESEIQTLSQNYSAMKLTQSKYAESDLAMRSINPENKDKEILVPLTSSLYIPGKIKDVHNVLVDIGTGYYVKKKTAHAREFFKRKVPLTLVLLPFCASRHHQTSLK